MSLPSSKPGYTSSAFPSSHSRARSLPPKPSIVLQEYITRMRFRLDRHPGHSTDFTFRWPHRLYYFSYRRGSSHERRRGHLAVGSSSVSSPSRKSFCSSNPHPLNAQSHLTSCHSDKINSPDGLANFRSQIGGWLLLTILWQSSRSLRTTFGSPLWHDLLFCMSTDCWLCNKRSLLGRLLRPYRSVFSSICSCCCWSPRCCLSTTITAEEQGVRVFQLR